MRNCTTWLIEGIVPDLALETVFRCLKLKDDPLNKDAKANELLL